MNTLRLIIGGYLLFVAAIFLLSTVTLMAMYFAAASFGVLVLAAVSGGLSAFLAYLAYGVFTDD